MSLDYDEFVIDPKNRNSKPYQVGDCVGDYIDRLPARYRLHARSHILGFLQDLRKEAGL